MALSIEEVQHIAQLARLRLTADEERLFQTQLSDILDYAARLQAVDTDHIAATANVLKLAAPLRPDEPRQSPPRPEILANAAETEDGQFRVPPVLDGGR
ncbi:MAG: Asp-tRNA(Asn)/Glu-tRNA(Gln) amidotransferase subunit GatC [Anaerolineales bacterium]